MATRKKTSENSAADEFGEWDTSVTDPPRVSRLDDAEDDIPSATVTATPATAPSSYDEKDFDLMGNPSTSEVDLDAPAVERRATEIRIPPVKETPLPPHRAKSAPPLVSGFGIDTSQSYTTIGPSIVIRGKLKCDENLIVSGRLEADVKSTKDLRIESQGIVNANIDVHAASISGIVVGDIRASELVELGSEARVVGDISTPRLIIHDGAKFRGYMDMDGLQALELVKAPTPRVQAPVQVETPKSAPAAIEAPKPARVVVAEVVSDTPPPTPNRSETPARSTVAPLEPMALKPQVKPSRPAPAPLPAATPSARIPTPAPAKTAEKAPEPDKGGGWFGRRS